LVVQPASGGGLMLVGADGANPQQICAVAMPCDQARDPVWSPDGSDIVFASGRGAGVSVIYPDGSCLACPAPGWETVKRSFGPGFLPDGRLAAWHSFTYPPRLGAVSTDGIGFQPFHVSGYWQQSAWSATGQLAAVRWVRGTPEVFMINPLTGAARQVTHDGASSPSWSPDAGRLAVVHDGWIELVGSHGGRPVRLTRGRAPAWSPDGKQLAFVGAHDRLFVITLRGGTPRPVGHIVAARVDWQPVTGAPPNRCQAPAGSTVLAASPDATVTIDRAPDWNNGISPGFSVLGCLASDGRERLLESLSVAAIEGKPDVGAVAVAGDYAALVNEATDLHYGGTGNTVAVFDLRTGAAVANAGGESADCPDFSASNGGCPSGIDQLVVGAGGVTAAHTFVQDCRSLTSCTSVEQIVANDNTGTHILDSITTPTSYDGPRAPSQLSDLTLSGNTLTWSHAGTMESAQLT
jgi:hypothetical protein